ncbi:sigma-70 family RNA polymerase sigma factor [Rossellomorea yichunensis]|uniref:sigma-70 family RNA polymerase sigma factor n=1 Tax=Rossellomorea yichunensis TaxID=3077331 RepID=UPI0028DD4EBF|nr:sigma-70 family RNA polymerase sigma factor [Rossellomorea sp. YC4-1]MDT9027482.1 sigma-70 family RNA polymerase sigma factor [Rossellomorea sp. YC4-1]
MDSLKEKFYRIYPDLKGNKAVESFLSQSKHQELLKEFLTSPSPSAEDYLNEAFKAHYFAIRFTSYVSSSLYFHSVNFDKKIRLHRGRQLLTLDQPLSGEKEGTFKDIIPDSEESFILPEQSLKDAISDDALLAAFRKLTNKQRAILDLAYVNGMSDTEIARVLRVTQQAVSKSHRNALARLREELQKGA